MPQTPDPPPGPNIHSASPQDLMTELVERAGRHWNALAGLFVSEAVKEVWLALLALDDQGALDSAGAHAELWGLLERAAADRVEEIRR